jgi:centromere protein I
LLWRSRAFARSDDGGVARGCLLPAAAAEQLQRWLPRVAPHAAHAALPAAFGLPTHPLLAALARDAFRELERRRVPRPDAVRLEGPASQRALVVLASDGGVNVEWREYRVWVVEWLARMGLGGIKELIFAAMKDLGKG